MKRDYAKERAILNRVRNRVDAALKVVEVELGGDVTGLKLGNGKFDDNGFRFKLEGVFKGGQNPEERAYEQLAKVLALPTRDYSGVATETDLHLAASGHLEDTNLKVRVTPGIQLPPLHSYVKTNGKGSVRIVGARVGHGRVKFNIICVRADGKRVCYRDEDIARLAKAQGVV